MRLIDADELIHIKIDEADPPFSFVPTEFIDAAPTVDPVKHGRWRKKWFSLARTEIAYCSACSKGTVWAFAYCPNCGAKMDEEAGHDDHL